MKFAVSSRQTAEYLRKADVIRVQWRDRDIILDLYEKYPQAEVHLVHYFTDEDIDWKEIHNLHILGKGKLRLGFADMENMNIARTEGYEHYYLGRISTFQELSDLKLGGVCGVYLDAPLFFQMDKVKRFGIPVYAVANLAIQTSLFQRPNGVNGTWIRPEDVETYEPYVEIIEFHGDLTQEQALFRIYAEEKKWSTDLNYLVQDLNYPATNRMIPPTLAEVRLNCGQRCSEGNKCHLCYNTLDLANPDLIKKILDKTENT